ncbi:hypothetical protein [Marinimicrobium agarilyticum]|uniref:hypothetical protein n=1 Tax=Marinimicrobium agarilyticum TaxID=306546 RepID=UPI000687CD7B|nr:hypothetical protein [Marinimicrobium agarilyticum]
MKAQKLIVRCLVSKRKGETLWVAQSVEFGLAAQGDSPEEAQQKLFAQVDDYIKEALREPEYRDQLLSRKAPIGFRLEYAMYTFFVKCKPIGQLISSFTRPSEHRVDTHEVRCA